MGMGLLTRILGVISFVGISTTFSRVDSATYPYSILQPSTFRHVVIPNAGQQNVDLYAPPLGSAPTALTVYAVRDPGEPAIEYFLARNGRNVHRSGWVTIAGKRLALERADFRGYRVRYRQEQVTFRAAGYFWRLTVSYDLRFKQYRGIMLRMLRSFRLR